MTVSVVLDAAGLRRSPPRCPATSPDVDPATRAGFYPTDPPTVEAIDAVVREARDDRHGDRLRALIVVLWRGSLRVAEASARRA